MDATKTFTPRALIVTIVVVASIATGAVLASAADKAEPIRRTIWGQTAPESTPGQELYLQRVEIDPGAELPVHFHEGTQPATIRAGVLTYHVQRGEFAVIRAGGKTETVAAPGTVKLRVGDTIVEPESLVHFGEIAGQAQGRDRARRAPALRVRRSRPPWMRPRPGHHAARRDHAHFPTRAHWCRWARTATTTYGWNRLRGTTLVDGQPVNVDMLGSVEYTNGSGPFSGFVTFFFVDGSTLGVSMQGITTAATNTTDTSFAATLGVIGGSGRYISAKGSGTFTGSRQTQLGGRARCRPRSS